MGTGSVFFRWFSVIAAVVIPAISVSAQEFQYSSKDGAIVQFSRDKNLELKGSVCAPSSEKFCETLDFTGENTTDKYVFKFHELEGTKDVVIEYARKRKDLGAELNGYSVWETNSPNAPDYLRTLKAPIAKNDDLSTQILKGWSGDKTGLVTLGEHIAITDYANNVREQLGYPASPKPALPIVLPRTEAASWEAIAQRVDKTGIAITNFGTGDALVYASKEVVKAAVENKEELLAYAANSFALDGGIGNIIDDNIFDISVRSESLFDKYVSSNSDIQSISSDLIYFLDHLLPAGKCGWAAPEDGRFSISCVAHSDDYQLRNKKMFVACVFSFIIGDQVDGFRRVTISQLTRGGARKKDLGPPSSAEFSYLPELNPDVASMGRTMRANLKNLLNIRYPRSQ